MATDSDFLLDARGSKFGFLTTKVGIVEPIL
jgi:hypothetical protein